MGSALLLTQKMLNWAVKKEGLSFSCMYRALSICSLLPCDDPLLHLAAWWMATKMEENTLWDSEDFSCMHEWSGVEASTLREYEMKVLEITNWRLCASSVYTDMMEKMGGKGKEGWPVAIAFCGVEKKMEVGEWCEKVVAFLEKGGENPLLLYASDWKREVVELLTHSPLSCVGKGHKSPSTERGRKRKMNRKG